MCGIFAVFQKDKIIEKDLFKFSLSQLEHRGPDNTATYYPSSIFWGLGHCRLSIIDQHSRSNQPYTKNNNSLIYNGEIYNYLTLKDKYSFLPESINSDTEMLFLMLKHNSNDFDFLESFRGMWAFFIFKWS